MLSQLENKFEGVEKITAQVLREIKVVQEDVLLSKHVVDKIYKEVKLLGDDLDHMADDFERLEQTAESVDNISRKNSIRLKGVREGVEGIS